MSSVALVRDQAAVAGVEASSSDCPASGGGATAPRCGAEGRAAQPGGAGFCAGGLREVDSRRAVERPGSEGQRLGAARHAATTTPSRCSPTSRRRSSAPARSAMSFSRSCHEGRRGSTRSPFLSWLPTSPSATRSCWCWTTFTSSRPRGAARFSRSSPNRCHPALSWCWSRVAIRECRSAACVQVGIWSRSGPRSSLWTRRRPVPLPQAVDWSCRRRRPRLCASGRRDGPPRSRWRRCRCEAATMPPTRAAGLTGTQQQIADYLLEEVLERQPDHLKRFLLGTSILDRMTAPLCDAVLGTTTRLIRSRPSRARMRSSSRSTIAASGTATTICSAISSERSSSVAIRSCSPCTWSGQRVGASSTERPDEAFAYAHESGDLAQAGRIALGHWDEFTGRGQIETLRLWLDRCTDEEIESDAQLSIAAAWVGRAARRCGPSEAVRRRGRAEAARCGIRRRGDLASLGTRESSEPPSLPTESTGCCVTPSSSTPRRRQTGTRWLLGACRALGTANVLLGRPQEAIDVFGEALALSSDRPELAHVGSSVSATWPSRPQRSAIGETRRDGRSRRYSWSKKRVSTR